MILIETWRSLKVVDKRRIETKLARALWHKVWFDIGKIALLTFLLAIIILSLGNLMPPQMADLAAVIKSLFSGRTIWDLIFSGGLGGISVVTLVLNIYTLPKTLALLDYAIRTAERHALRKNARDS